MNQSIALSVVDDRAFYAMVAYQKSEQNRQCAAHIVAECKLLPQQNQIELVEFFNRMKL